MTGQHPESRQKSDPATNRNRNKGKEQAKAKALRQQLPIAPDDAEIEIVVQNGSSRMLLGYLYSTGKPICGTDSSVPNQVLKLSA